MLLVLLQKDNLNCVVFCSVFSGTSSGLAALSFKSSGQSPLERVGNDGWSEGMRRLLLILVICHLNFNNKKEVIKNQIFFSFYSDSDQNQLGLRTEQL